MTLKDLTDDNERARAAFTGPDGLTLIASEKRHVGCSVVMVVTDERILFVADDGSAAEDDSDTGSLAYGNIAAVAVEGHDPAVLALSMANGVRWEFPLPDADRAVVGSVRRHLGWVGDLRSRLVACRNDVELAAGEIHDHAAEMAWDSAKSVYAEHRDRLDRLIDAVQRTEPINDRVIAPELAGTERTLERARARLAIEHAGSQLELGRQLVEGEEYERARDVLQTVQTRCERAAGRADAIERGDTFRFGEQRALREDIDRLQWEIETVAAEPIRRAHEAKIKAQNATGTSEAVEGWETAFRRYGSVLTLDSGDGGWNFADDPEKIRAETRAAAAALVDGHCDLARGQWNKGVTLERNGAVKPALLACADAIDHLDRAAELAAEFRPADAAAIERRRDGMAAALRGVQDTATVEDDTAGADRPADDIPAAGDPSAGREAGAGGAEELLDLDTHQEITFDATVEDGAADDRRRDRWEFMDDGSDTEIDVETDATSGSDGKDAVDSEMVPHSEE